MVRKAFGDIAITKTQVHEMVKAFEDHGEVIKDLRDTEHSSTTSNTKTNTIEIKKTASEDRIIDQRICLKFCVLNEISCIKALKMLRTTYEGATMSRTQTYEWYKAFKDGRDVCEDLPRSGRPSTSNTEENVAKIKRIKLEGRHVTEREIANELNISNGSVHHILHDVLGMKRANP